MISHLSQRVNTLGSDEGSMTLLELTVLYTTLSKKVESLEADLKQTKKVYGAAYTKLIKKVKKLEKTIKSNQARRRAKIVVSDDEEDLVGFLFLTKGGMIEEIINRCRSYFDAAKENVHTYTRKRRAVSLGSGGISTASSDIAKRNWINEERQRMPRVYKTAQSLHWEE
ncbi:hypothetical protein Tco_0899394 [Tanacetum coccineum]